MSSQDVAQSEEETTKDNAIRLTIPRRMMVVPGTAFVVGAAIGIMRGGREAALRFLAENAHRPPTTVQGWYFYNKTKNYKVMLGALKGGGGEAAKLSVLGLGYVGIEEGMERMGWGKAKHFGAAVGTALVFSGVYRLPMNMARRSLVLGVVVGGLMSGLDMVAERRPAGSPDRRE